MPHLRRRSAASVVEDAGVGFRHAEGFTIDRPSGLKCHLFLHFLTDVEILARDGMTQAQAGSCMIYPPRQRQWYRGAGCGLGNNWIHADAGLMSDLIRKYRIPVGMPFRPRQSSFILPLMTDIRREFMERRSYSQESMRILLEKLFIELARNLVRDGDAPLSPRKSELARKLREVRLGVHGNITRRWTVEEMAKAACLSPSRFSVLFKEFFQVTPVDDLINVRIERAKWLLSSSRLSVSQAAEQSGFENLSYFSRLFRKRVGVPPRDFAENL